MKFDEYYISELISEIAMGPFGSNIKVECFVDEGIPVLNGSNLTGFAMNDDAFRYVTEEKADSLKRANAYRGDVVITHRGTLGQISFIPSDSKYERYVISQSQFRVRCNEKILPEYLTYYFHTRIGQHKLLSNASQVGVPALARASTTFQKIKIEIPNIDVQTKIVGILESIRAKIEVNRAINRNLEAQAEGVYNEMIVNTNTVQTHELRELCKFQEGYVNPSQKNPEYFDGDVKWLRAVDINESFIVDTSRTLTQKGFESAKKSAYLFKPNTIAISKSGTIGRLGIIADYMCGNRAVINIAPNNEKYLPLIYGYLKSKQQEFEDLAVGSVQKNLYVSVLEPLKVNFPSNNIIERFCAISNALLNAMLINCKENKNLCELRDTLLPKLMSGELDVSSLDI